MIQLNFNFNFNFNFNQLNYVLQYSSSDLSLHSGIPLQREDWGTQSLSLMHMMKPAGQTRPDIGWGPKWSDGIYNY